MSDLISKKELYHKLGEAYNKGFLSWGANEVIKDIIGECHSVENKCFDGMTNGEVLQALFPNVSKYNNMLLENHSRNILFDDDWWNTPYKAEKETDK